MKPEPAKHASPGEILVVGAGAWGTALARLLTLAGHSVTLWAHRPELLETIEATGRNEQFLPGIELPPSLRYEADLAKGVSSANLIVLAVPSKALREVSRQIQSFAGLIVSVTKGIEYDTGLTMSGVLGQTCPNAKIAVLSGPSFAAEVACEIPTAVVASSADPAAAKAVQATFHAPALRVYTSSDLLGVELGGALKNVVAIAAGLSDGLGFGDNSKAAIVTRAIVEIKRLGVASGARPQTFNGLSGLGDLVVTCFSKLSRNRGFGERMGRGEKPEAIAQSMKAVAEGYPTARSAHRLAQTKGVSTPIIDEVFAMLYEGKEIRTAVRDLMTRDPKPEQ